jgi:hypothetical protein
VELLPFCDPVKCWIVVAKVVVGGTGHVKCCCSVARPGSMVLRKSVLAMWEGRGKALVVGWFYCALPVGSPSN